MNILANQMFNDQVVGTLSLLFNRLREPTERAIVGDWIRQTRSRLPEWCPCTGDKDKDAPKGKKFVPPQKLAAAHPARLRRKGAAAAAVPFCSAFTVGLGCHIIEDHVTSMLGHIGS